LKREAQERRQRRREGSSSRTEADCDPKAFGKQNPPRVHPNSDSSNWWIRTSIRLADKALKTGAVEDHDAYDEHQLRYIFRLRFGNTPKAELVTLTELGRQRRRSRLPDIAEWLVTHTHEGNPVAAAETEEEVSQVRSHLTGFEFDCLMLTAGKGLTHTEVAELYKVTRRDVTYAVQTALDKVRPD